MPITLTLALVALVLLAGWFDLQRRKIPNWLSVFGLAAGMAFGGFQGLAGVKAAVLGCLCALAVYVPLYMLRGMGAGDVKLMAAVGALTGPSNWLIIFLVTAILGGIAAFGLVIYRRAGKRTAFNLFLILSELAHFRRPSRRAPELDIRNQGALRLPHGAVIALGSLVVAATVGLR